MTIKRFAAALLAAACLSGCQYTAETRPIAAYNVYSSYEDVLPGTYLLYVDGSALNTTIAPADFNCAAHRYPLAVSDGFAGSVRKTFDNLLENVEVVEVPVSREDLAASGARAMIVVRGERIDGRLRVVPGFWTATIDTEVEIAASIVVDGRGGRLLGKTVSGTGVAQANAGGFCEGGADALTQSAEEAMREAVMRLGEALANSERIRAGT